MNKKQILSYEELYEAYLIASQERYKYKEVIDTLEQWLEVNDKYSQGYFKQVLEYINTLKNNLDYWRK